MAWWGLGQTNELENSSKRQSGVAPADPVCTCVGPRLARLPTFFSEKLKIHILSYMSSKLSIVVPNFANIVKISQTSLWVRSGQFASCVEEP